MGASLTEWIWGVIARFLARPAVTAWLIRRAERTPYSHLSGYMERYWLFNSYEGARYVRWLPSIRLHRILREDRDRHTHNHPWTFRSILLSGGYTEARGPNEHGCYWHCVRGEGTTYRLSADAFHQIGTVRPGAHGPGVVTLFITWRYQHTWGFKTEAGFVPWRKYLGIEE